MEDLIRDKRFTGFIISANTHEQLYEDGIDSKGNRLGDYAYNTIYGVPGKYKGKIEKGQRYDHITLNDEGDFYRSWRLYLDSRSDVKIEVQSIKGSVDLLQAYGKDVVGLTEENLSRLRDLCIIILREKVLHRLRNVKLKAA